MKKLRSFNNDFPYSKDEKYVNEKIIYEEMKISNNVKEENIDFDKIKNRKTERFLEKDYNKPQNIFFIKLNEEITIFGRKLLSILRQKKLIPSINCSLISSSMIIGILSDYKKEEREIAINYYPLTDGEKKCLFSTIKLNRAFDIYHPFIFYDYYTRKESDSPIDGWKIRKNTKNELFNGEQHIRDFTIKFLNTIDVTDNAIFFDPACSTGDFLSSIKNIYPTIKTIRQDLGIEMVKCAQEKLDIVYHGDALNSPVDDESIDFLFLRFLNFRVVTSEKAKKIYFNLIKKVKNNGYIICFGHTPVLLLLEDLKVDNLKIISCNGYSKEYDSIFQYYILKKEV